MSIWKHCTITTLYYSNDESSDDPCVVKIDADRILAEYEDEGTVQYTGSANGEGHFELKGVDFDGRATLHMFSGSSVLEGSWVEKGDRGMWRIKLA